MIKLIRSKTGIIGMATLAVALCVWFIVGRGGTTGADIPLIPVQKGTIQINVLQGGEIRALQNIEVKSEIELPTKILSLIPEGYRINEKDVKDGKVLIELDSADLRDKITNHEIEFQTTVSTFIEADEQRAIQTSDNQSLARDAEQAMRFALMDFERYMGKGNAQTVLKARKLPHDLEALEFYIGKLNAEKPRTLNLELDAEKADKASEDPLAEKEGKVDPLKASQEVADATTPAPPAPAPQMTRP